MRRLLPLVLVAAAVLAVAALAGVGRPEAARSEVATPDTVTTLGHGVVTVAPDEATVSAGVHTQAASASEALAGDPRYREALAKAVDDARLKAEALAKAGGFGVGPVSSVTEGASQGRPVETFAAVAGKRDAATPIEPGTQDVTADVTVTFRIR